MALAATTDVDVRTTATTSDASGGGFDTASSGTDYSQQDSPQVVYTDLIIDATTNTNCTSAATPFTSQHVGNIINITGGPGFTVQRVQIVSVASGVATCDKSLGTLSSTGGTGNLGGAMKTSGGAGLVPVVAGNRIWLKYHASNVYSVTSTTNNVANGRLSITVGATTAPILVRGYETTHGDFTGNRPTIRAGVALAGNVMISLGGTAQSLENLIIDGNRTNFSLTRGVNLGGAANTVYWCKFTSFNNGACNGNASSSACEWVGCEFTDNVTTTCCIISNATAGQLYGCYFHDNTVIGISFQISTTLNVVRCIFDTNTTALEMTTTGRLFMYECTVYNSSSYGVELKNSGGQYSFINCIFETNTTYGIATTAASTYGSVRINKCGFNANTNPYDTSKILSQNIIDAINGPGSPNSFFVDAPNGDFRLNNTAGQGLLLKALAFPVTFPGGVANYQDVGGMQHQDSSGGGGAGPLVGPGRLIRA